MIMFVELKVRSQLQCGFSQRSTKCSILLLCMETRKKSGINYYLIF